MKNAVLSGFVLTASILIFSACKKENLNSNSIIGQWELTSDEIVSNGQFAYSLKYEAGKSYIYQISSDNIYTLKYLNKLLEKGTYIIDSNKLFQHFIGVGIERFGTFNYTIKNKTLTLFNNGHDIAGDFTETFIYIRPKYFIR